MELLHKIALLAVFVGVVGVITVPPVLADDDDDDDDDKNWGQNKKSDNQVALIQRSVPFDLCGSQTLCDATNGNGKRLQESYACNEGEIILGGMVVAPMDSSELGSWDIDNVKQEFKVSLSNRQPESVSGNVVYLCASMKP